MKRIIIGIIFLILFCLGFLREILNHEMNLAPYIFGGSIFWIPGILLIYHGLRSKGKIDIAPLIIIGTILIILFLIVNLGSIGDEEIELTSLLVGSSIIFLLPGILCILFGLRSNKKIKSVSSTKKSKRSISKKQHAAPSPKKQIVFFSTLFKSQAEAEEVLATSPDSEARLEAATALGKTNSIHTVEALGKALLSDEDKYVRSLCAGYLGSIKGSKSEKALLKAMADKDPDVRKMIVKSLFRIGTEQARMGIQSALKDANPQVRAEAKECTSNTKKKVQKRLCPFLSESGLCEPPGVSDLYECSWEIEGKGHYKGCFVYQMHTHPGGPSDLLRKL